MRGLNTSTLRNFFDASKKIKSKAKEIITLVCGIDDSEEVINVRENEDNPENITVDTERLDDYDCYDIPKKYFLMTENEIKQDIFKKQSGDLNETDAEMEVIRQIRESSEFKEYLKLKKLYSKYDYEN